MMSLPVFLLARLDEDDSAAKASLETGYQPPPWGPEDHPEYVPDFYDPPTDEDRKRVARVRADVEAKRRIVAEHGPHPDDPGSCVTCSAYESTDTTGPPFPCPTLRLLALPYADHPEYRAEWKP